MYACMYVYIYIYVYVYLYINIRLYIWSALNAYSQRKRKDAQTAGHGGAVSIYIYSDIGDGLVLGLPDYQIFPIRFLQEASCGTGAQR